MATFASNGLIQWPDKYNLGLPCARFYMGMDYENLASRVWSNLGRAGQFKTDATSESEYITMSCKDTKNLCGLKIEGKSVGGYAWTCKLSPFLSSFPC